jgi:predicted site-specific integrase-resolvase
MTLVDTKTAAAALGVEPATIRQWVHRGKLEVAGKRHGRNLYRLDDLASLDTRTVTVTP